MLFRSTNNGGTLISRNNQIAGLADKDFSFSVIADKNARDNETLPITAIARLSGDTSGTGGASSYALVRVVGVVPAASASATTITSTDSFVSTLIPWLAAALLILGIIFILISLYGTYKKRTHEVEIGA